MIPRKRKLIVLVPLIIVGLIISTRYLTRSDDEVGVIRVSGNIEVTDAEVSFKIPGRVESRLVSEGQTIYAGQRVAQLDSAELERETGVRKAELQAAKAQLAEFEAGSRPEEIAQAEASARRARARLDELLAGSRAQEVAVAEATVRQARAEAERQKAEFERQKYLHDNGIIAAQQFDLAMASHEVASARLKETNEHLELVREGPRAEEIEQARAALAEVNERYLLVKKGPREETIEQARARVEQARQTLGLAETRLGYASLVSPLSGVVLSENVEAGEYVASGTPVVTVGDLQNVWLRAYVNESDLGRVKVGQPVRVTADTYPDKVYQGYVSFIASEAEFTPKNVQTEKERVKLVYRIKIDIPNPNMELKPGMPADADIVVTEEGRQ
ncbi:MAG: HlyD family efflux transporter periplasmic adaptor subunit [Candidatus Abyssobacteria bacterium SURF_17]|uniref:HlyD family efflux transporter periplasmic adaptor subunit n=1 Tax=Candidatus Abyssobacteria bacterium SURF_17 TaxID=2093361 RepID=A0A419ERI5_9BACT|nr:MAG: HlyD family efflux transporter periplasmic adaptor subunit [Candidatus Abyssubacteria bacterium SURF_17]